MRPFASSLPAASEVEKENACDRPATTLTTGLGILRGEEKGRNCFYAPCNYGDAQGLFSSEADSFQGMWIHENAYEKGPNAKWPVATEQHKRSMCVASTGPFVRICIWENNLENAIEYLLKEKIYNNSVLDMPLLANNSASWKG